MTDIQKENKSGGKVPNLRFPGFFYKWEITELTGLGEFLGGGTPSSSNDDFWKGNVPWISSSDLSENNIHSVNVSRFITEEAINNSATKLCSAPVILIVSRVGVGKVAYSGKSLCTSQDFLNIINFKCNGIFLSYLLSTEMKKAASAVQGTSIKGISSVEIKSKKLYIPKISEQNKIASFLSLIDERITTQSKIIEQIEFYFKGIKDNLFSQKIRFGDFADDWKTKKLGDVLLKNSTKNKNQRYSTVQSVSNKYGFINQEDIFEDRRVASVDTSNYYVIDKGCFAYNPSRINVGSLAYKFDDKISIISPLYISFKAENIFLIDTFLLYWFKTIEFTKQMNNSFEGSVRNTLSYENLIKMNISIPSLEEQIQISSFLTKIDQKIQTEKTILEQLEMQKKYLLQQMFV